MESFGISTERADAAKAKYYKLHQKVVESMSNEKKLLDQARHLKRKLDVSAVALMLYISYNTNLVWYEADVY